MSEDHDRYLRSCCCICRKSTIDKKKRQNSGVPLSKVVCETITLHAILTELYGSLIYAPQQICRDCERKVLHFFSNRIGYVGLPRELPVWSAHGDGCSFCEDCRKPGVKPKVNKAELKPEDQYLSPQHDLPTFTASNKPACRLYRDSLIISAEARIASTSTAAASTPSPHSTRAATVGGAHLSPACTETSTRTPSTRKRRKRDILFDTGEQVHPTGFYKSFFEMTPQNKINKCKEMAISGERVLMKFMNNAKSNIYPTQLKFVAEHPKTKEFKRFDVKFPYFDEYDTCDPFKSVPLLTNSSIATYREYQQASDGGLAPLNQVLEAREIIMRPLPPAVAIKDAPFKLLQGVQYNVLELIQLYMQTYIDKAGLSMAEVRDKWIIKFSGDGTIVQRGSCWTISSFTLIRKDLVHPIGTYAFHAMVSKEDLGEMTAALNDAKGIIEKLMEAGVVNVECEGRPVAAKVDVLFSADMKFAREFMGMMSCKSKFPCLFCKQKKDAPKASEISSDHYNKPEYLRTKDNIPIDADSKEHDQLYPPLILFDPQTEIVLDEMHMLCRVVENLIKKLACEAARKDNVEKKKEGKSNLDQLKEMIQCQHPKFNIYPKSMDGYSKWNIVDTVGGNLRKLLHSCFPEQLASAEFLNEDGRTDISLLWLQTRKLFNTISADQPTVQQVADYGDDALEWLAIFNRLTSYKKDPRYQSHDLSPYQHMLLFHVQSQLQRHGRLKVFNAEGVEKLNFTLKEALKLTNRMNSMEDTMKRYHTGILSEPFKRIPRQYDKKDQYHWHGFGSGPSGVQMQTRKLFYERSTPLDQTESDLKTTKNRTSHIIIAVVRQRQVQRALSKQSAGTLAIPDPAEMSTAQMRLYLNKFAGNKTQAKTRKKLTEEFVKEFGEKSE